LSREGDKTDKLFPIGLFRARSTWGAHKEARNRAPAHTEQSLFLRRILPAEPPQGEGIEGI